MQPWYDEKNKIYTIYLSTIEIRDLKTKTIEDELIKFPSQKDLGKITLQIGETGDKKFIMESTEENPQGTKIILNKELYPKIRSKNNLTIKEEDFELSLQII